MQVVAVDPEAPDPSRIAAAGAALRDGALVAFPTETVYGLGANALDEQALARVYAAKGRPADNPLIVHLASAEDLPSVAAAVTPLARRLAERFWPGPLTLVLEGRPELAPQARSRLGTVAVRVPDHPVALALLRAAGVPVAAPSANRSGRPSPTTAAHVADDLGDAVDLVVDGGPCRVGVESTVVDVRGDRPVVLRDGGVAREALGAAGDAPGSLASPGTRHAHYQPACRVEVVAAEALAARAAALGGRVGVVSRAPAPAGTTQIARFADASGLARVLYDALRDAERRGVDVVLVEAVPETGIGRAVMDRLRRAAAR